MPRRVLLISRSFPPLVAVGGFRAARFAKFLPEFGWEAIVLAGSADEPGVATDPSRLSLVSPATTVVRAAAWRVPDRLRRGLSYRTSLTPLGRAEEAARFDPPTGQNRNNGSRWSVRSLLRSVIRGAMAPLETPDRHVLWNVPAYRAARRAIEHFRPEVILSSSPPHSSHLISLALSKATGLPFVMDLRDPWTRNPWEETHNWRFRRTANRYLERHCVARASAVILNTPEMLDEFKAVYPKAWHGKFFVIPNGYDPDLRARIESLSREPSAVGRDKVTRLCHAGAVYGRRDIRPLIAAVARLGHAGLGIVFEQVGSIDHATDVAECIAQHRAAPFVELAGCLSHEQALRRQMRADILVAVRQNSRLQAPAKLYEMMLFGKPILALDDTGAATRLVEDYGLGVAADPVDANKIAAAVVSLAGWENTHCGNRGMHDQRATALVEFDARNQTAGLASLLERVVEAHHTQDRLGGGSTGQAR